MTWFKVDDGFWSHPKTATLSDAAVTLWVRAGSYSCQHLTDGFVKSGALRLLGDPEAVGELVAADLWHEVDGGWVFHDWDEYQETSDAVKKRREEARERQRKFRELQEEKRRQSQQSSQSESHVTDEVTNDVTSRPPTRPDPTRPDQSLSPNGDKDVVVTQVDPPSPETPPKATRTRGSKIDPDWMPSQSVIDAMKAECPQVDLEAEHRKFIDHYLGNGKTMKDWDAAWRNWIRKAPEMTRRPLKVVNGGSSTVDDKVNGWFDIAGINSHHSTGRELE